MRLFILFFFMLISFVAYSQQGGNHGTIKVRKNIPVKDFVDLDFIPEYNYGNIYEVIQGSMKYPKDAKEKGLEGEIKVLVIISQGAIVWSQLQNSLSKSLDKEARRIISGLSTFKLTRKDGELVNVRTTIPIKFSLQ